MENLCSRYVFQVDVTNGLQHGIEHDFHHNQFQLEKGDCLRQVRQTYYNIILISR